jgi:chemotaxis protein methyltransferase CheR
MHALHDDTFGRIAGLMHEAIGLHLAPAKKSLVSSRLAPRIQRWGWTATRTTCS